MTMPVSVVVDQNNNSVYINVGGTPTLDTTSGGTGVTLVSAMDGGTGTICRTTRLTQAR